MILLSIILSVLIVLLVIIQGRGAGLGSAWGGGGEFYQSRRGIEKVTLYATAILIIVFLIVSVINILL